jgi:hypothetical protein
MRLNPSPETQTIAKQKKKKKKKKEHKCCYEEEKRKPPLLNTPAEKSRPGLTGSLQLNLSTAVFPIPIPPVFPQPRLRSLQKLLPTAAILLFSSTCCCFFTRVSSNGDKGQQENKLYCFLFADVV